MSAFTSVLKSDIQSQCDMLQNYVFVKLLAKQIEAGLCQICVTQAD